MTTVSEFWKLVYFEGHEEKEKPTEFGEFSLVLLISCYISDEKQLVLQRLFMIEIKA